MRCICRNYFQSKGGNSPRHSSYSTFLKDATTQGSWILHDGARYKCSYTKRIFDAENGMICRIHSPTAVLFIFLNELVCQTVDCINFTNAVGYRLGSYNVHNMDIPFFGNLLSPNMLGPLKITRLLLVIGKDLHEMIAFSSFEQLMANNNEKLCQFLLSVPSPGKGGFR